MRTDLFNSTGSFIAARSGNYLFNRQQKWIGWFPWPKANTNAVDVKGNYLGTVIGDYLLRLPALSGISTPAYAGYHGYPGYIGAVARRAPFVDEAGVHIRELRAAGVAEHTIRELYPEGELKWTDTVPAALNGQAGARLAKSLGDWLGL